MSTSTTWASSTACSLRHTCFQIKQHLRDTWGQQGRVASRLGHELSRTSPRSVALLSKHQQCTQATAPSLDHSQGLSCEDPALRGGFGTSYTSRSSGRAALCPPGRAVPSPRVEELGAPEPPEDVFDWYPISCNSMPRSELFHIRYSTSSSSPFIHIVTRSISHRNTKRIGDQ